MSDAHSTQPGWPGAVNPALVARLYRPAVQPGLISRSLAEGVLARVTRLENRLPLLADLKRRHSWSTAVPAGQAPIVYASLPAEAGAEPAADAGPAGVQRRASAPTAPAAPPPAGSAPTGASASPALRVAASPAPAASGSTAGDQVAVSGSAITPAAGDVAEGMVSAPAVDAQPADSPQVQRTATDEAGTVAPSRTRLRGPDGRFLPASAQPAPTPVAPTPADDAGSLTAAPRTALARSLMALAGDSASDGAEATTSLSDGLAEAQATAGGAAVPGLPVVAADEPRSDGDSAPAVLPLAMAGAVPGGDATALASAPAEGALQRAAAAPQPSPADASGSAIAGAAAVTPAPADGLARMAVPAPDTSATEDAAVESVSFRETGAGAPPLVVQAGEPHSIETDTSISGSLPLALGSAAHPGDAGSVAGSAASGDVVQRSAMGPGVSAGAPTLSPVVTPTPSGSSAPAPLQLAPVAGVEGQGGTSDAPSLRGPLTLPAAPSLPPVTPTSLPAGSVARAEDPLRVSAFPAQEGGGISASAGIQRTEAAGAPSPGAPAPVPGVEAAPRVVAPNPPRSLSLSGMPMVRPGAGVMESSVSPAMSAPVQRQPEPGIVHRRPGPAAGWLQQMAEQTVPAGRSSPAMAAADAGAAPSSPPVGQPSGAVRVQRAPLATLADTAGAGPLAQPMGAASPGSDAGAPRSPDATAPHAAPSTSTPVVRSADPAAAPSFDAGGLIDVQRAPLAISAAAVESSGSSVSAGTDAGDRSASLTPSPPRPVVAPSTRGRGGDGTQLPPLTLSDSGPAGVQRSAQSRSGGSPAGTTEKPSAAGGATPVVSANRAPTLSRSSRANGSSLSLPGQGSPAVSGASGPAAADGLPGVGSAPPGPSLVQRASEAPSPTAPTSLALPVAANGTATNGSSGGGGVTAHAAPDVVHADASAAASRLPLVDALAARIVPVVQRTPAPLLPAGTGPSVPALTVAQPLALGGAMTAAASQPMTGWTGMTMGAGGPSLQRSPVGGEGADLPSLPSRSAPEEEDEDGAEEDAEEQVERLAARVYDRLVQRAEDERRLRGW